MVILYINLESSLETNGQLQNQPIWYLHLTVSKQSRITEKDLLEAISLS